MKTWIIGNAEGSIGHALEEMLHGKNSGHHVIGTGTEVDMRVPDKVQDWVDKHGPFNNVVYCAGIARLEWIKDLNLAETMNVFGVNVFGFMTMLKAVTTTQGHGNIVALVSDSSHVAMRGSMAYCTSKAALHQAVKVAARELAPHWRVNGVSPSIVAGTRMTKFIDETVPGFRGWDPDKAKEYESSLVPIGRRATKLEVARVLLDVMMGPDFMTGSIVEMTGGK